MSRPSNCACPRSVGGLWADVIASRCGQQQWQRGQQASTHVQALAVALAVWQEVRLTVVWFIASHAISASSCVANRTVPKPLQPPTCAGLLSTGKHCMNA